MFVVKVFAHGGAEARLAPAPTFANRYWKPSLNRGVLRWNWIDWLWRPWIASRPITTSDEVVVDGVRVALRRRGRRISVEGREARLSKAQWESFQRLSAAGPSGVTYAELDGLEAPLNVEGFRSWRNRVQQAMCKLNKKLADNGIPLVACPISKNAYVLAAAYRQEGTPKRRYLEIA